MKIHACMIGIMQAVQAIAKDRRNDQQNFKFRGIDDVYANLHYIFAEKGVICLPQVDYAQMKQEVIKTSTGKDMQHTTVPVTFVFMAVDGSTISCSTVGEAMDMADKSTAKCLSMAHKYALIQTFLIPVADVAEGDGESYFVDAKEELAKVEALREQVLSGNGAQELNDADAAALLRKRQEVAESAAKNGDEGMTPVTPVEPQTPPEPIVKRARAKAEKPEEKAPAADPVTPPATTPAPEPPDDQSPFNADPPATPPSVGDWRSHKINVIKVPEFKDVLVGEMTPDDVRRLFLKWVIKQGLAILCAKSPECAAEAMAIDAAMEHHLPEERAKAIKEAAKEAAKKAAA